MSQSQLGLFDSTRERRDPEPKVPSVAMPRSDVASLEPEWPKPVRARRTDPLSSHAAADEAERRGFIVGHKRMIVAAIVRSPGCTAHQISLATGLSVVQIDRRTGELEDLGWITRPDKKKVFPLRHYPTEKAERHFPGMGPQRPESKESAISAGEMLGKLAEKKRAVNMACEVVIVDRRLS